MANGWLFRAAEFGEDTAGGFRVSEADHEVLGAGAGGLVDEAHFLGGQLVEGFVGVGYREGDVVDALAAVLDELRDGALRTCRLQELDLGLAHLEEGGLYLLVGDLFDVVAFHPEDVLVIRDGGF